jgi:iron complex outermembrane receptor protein
MPQSYPPSPLALLSLARLMWRDAKPQHRAALLCWSASARFWDLMLRRSLSFVLATLFCALALLFVRPAWADARTDARAHFKKGMEAIGKERYAEGIAELEQAYELLPHPNVLFNIARAKVLMGDLRGGLGYYKRYLEGNPEDKDDVAKTVQELEERITREQAERAKPPPVEPVSDAGAPNGSSADAAAPPPPTTDAGPTVRPSPAAPSPAARTEDVFEESVVTASKTAESPLNSPSSTSIITEQDIRLSGITKIPELLRRLAGVDIMQVTGGQTEVSLRGFNQRLSNKVLVLVDGRSVYADFIGATFWQSLSIGVEDIKQIEVVRGPGSALYGAVAVNGVINIITRGPEDGRGGVHVAFGEQQQTHGSLWAAGRSAGFGWRASAGYDYLPRWSREVPDGRSDIRLGVRDQDSAARTVRLDFRGSRELTKGYSLGLGGGFTQGSLETLGVGTLNDLVLPRFVATDVTATLTAKILEARVYYNRFEADTTLNAATVGQSLLPARADQNVLNADLLARLPFKTGGVNHKLTLGGTYRYKNIDYTFLDSRRVEHHAALFVQEEARINKYLAIVGDYRLDYVPYLRTFVQSPRGAVLVHPSKHSTIRALAATAFRPPTFLESYLDVPVQLPQAGGALLSQGFRSDDPAFRLKPENIFSAELGYLQHITKDDDTDVVVLDSSLFYNRVSSLIQLADARGVTLGDVRRGAGALDSETGLFPLYFGGFANQCQLYNVFGAEVGARTFPVQGLDLYANYTLNLVRQDNSACGAQRPEADQRTSAHKINAGVQLRTKFGLDGSIDFHVVTAQRWIERVVSVETQSIASAGFSLPAYTLLNAKIGYRFLNDRAEIGASGFNILDTQHREHPFGQLVRRRVMGMFSYKF